MNNTEISCLCGAVKIQINGDPAVQFYCHCIDCQTAAGGAYIPIMMFPSDAVNVTQGEPAVWALKSLPRQHCPKCATQLFIRLEEKGMTGVKANLFPKGTFKPQFHIHCQEAAIPVKDDLPHFKGFPAAFGGSDDVVEW